jgi:haloacetate dehalogenase
LFGHELGYDKFYLMGHDRGARVAHRLAFDFGERVKKLVVLDIVPTHTMFSRLSPELASAYWHWFYFQAPDLPEIMLANSAESFLKTMLNSLSWKPGVIEDDMFAEYLRVFTYQERSVVGWRIIEQQQRGILKMTQRSRN